MLYPITYIYNHENSYTQCNFSEDMESEPATALYDFDFYDLTTPEAAKAIEKSTGRRQAHGEEEFQLLRRRRSCSPWFDMQPGDGASMLTWLCTRTEPRAETLLLSEWLATASRTLLYLVADGRKSILPFASVRRSSL